MKLLLAGLLVVGMLTAACDDDDTPTPSAEATICQQLNELQAAVAGITSSSTIEEIQSAGDKVKAEANDVKAAAADAADARVDAVQQASNDLVNAVDDITNDMTLADAQASVQDDVAALSVAREALRADVNCP